MGYGLVAIQNREVDACKITSYVSDGYAYRVFYRTFHYKTHNILQKIKI
jgi:hypothetical protein